MIKRKYTAEEIKEIIALIELGAAESFKDTLEPSLKSDREKEIARFVFNATMSAYKGSLYEILGR